MDLLGDSRRTQEGECLASYMAVECSMSDAFYCVSLSEETAETSIFIEQ